MPKVKVHKGAAKRFKKTGSGLRQNNPIKAEAKIYFPNFLFKCLAI